MTKALNESEDLFPGLTASAFDEHNTLRSNKRPPDQQSEWLDNQIERVEFLEKHVNSQFNRTKQSMKNNDVFIQSWNAVSGNVEYKSIAGFEAQFPLTYDILVNVYFDPNSPAKVDIPKYVMKMERLLERRNDLKAQLKKIKTRASTARRMATANNMKKRKESATRTTIPESSIPKTIVVKYFDGSQYPGGKSTPFEWEGERKTNPYWDTMLNSRGRGATVYKYAGHPAHFDWQKREKTSFFLLSKLVENLGLPELSVLYAQRNKDGGEVVYYMENADKSAQILKSSQHGVMYVYIQDTKLDTWEKFVDIKMVRKWREELDLNAELIKKYGKKP